MSENELELDDGLEWVKLRDELQGMRQTDMETARPHYKYNWYMPVAISITGALYFWGLYNMHDVKRSARAAYCRVTSQCLTGILFAYGFINHYNKEINLYKDERRRKALMDNVTSS